MMDAEEQHIQPPQGRSATESNVTYPGSAVVVQLIAKTTSLSIAGRESEPDGSHFPSDSWPSSRIHPEVDGGAEDAEFWRKDAMSAQLEVTSTPLTSPLSPSPTEETLLPPEDRIQHSRDSIVGSGSLSGPGLLDLPNEVLFQILSYLDVCDLLATSRTSRRLRALCLTPYLHHARLRRARLLLQPMLFSPSRPTLADLMRRSIVLTHTEFASRRLAHSLASIRLSRRLAARPSPETLVERCVLPAECLPLCHGKRPVVAPSLVARKRAIERERMKAGLSRWLESVWKSEVVRREEDVRMTLERAGIGRVWRLRRFWERVSRGES